MNTDYNPYAPPRAPLGVEHRSPGLKPRTVVWAMIALWVAYGFSFAHGVIVIGERWLTWPPEFVALSQIGSELFYLALIYFVSRGLYLARLIYAVSLGVRTMNVIQYFSADWQSSHGLVLITILSFACQYLAMYWLFTEPGRRWFVRSRNPL